ncbi:MAG: AAA family ATPase [Hellea sp.]
MPDSKSDTAAITAQALNAHLNKLDAQFVGRRSMLELILLGLIMHEHVLLIGPPGTGKSAAVQAMASGLKVKSFEYLIGRFTEPSELFGGLDLNALKDGQVKPVIDNMLPEAEIAFLDEIFLGSTAILNSLLKILNERTYQRGQFSVRTPLMSCVAASNHLPDDPLLAAFADRFLLTMFVDPVNDEQLLSLLDVGWQQFQKDNPRIKPLPKTTITKLHQASLEVDLSEVREAYAHIMRKLRLLGVNLSDRKIVKGQKAIAVAALMRGKLVAGPEDLWPVTYLVQDPARQSEARELLETELKNTHNPVLSTSAAEATYGATAHAAQLLGLGEALIADKPSLRTDANYEMWLVRLESLQTRIDAAFEPKDLPQGLRLLRTSLISHLENQDDSSQKETSHEPQPAIPITTPKPNPWGAGKT